MYTSSRKAIYSSVVTMAVATATTVGACACYDRELHFWCASFLETMLQDGTTAKVDFPCSYMYIFVELLYAY